MPTSRHVLGIVVLLALTACAGPSSPSEMAAELDHAASSGDAEAFRTLLGTPADSETAAIVEQASGSAIALVDPDFSASGRDILLDGHRFGTVTDGGSVAVGSPAVLLIEPAMGWRVAGATPGRAGDYALLPGGSYRLVDTGGQDLFMPVLDGEPVEDGGHVTATWADRISLEWQLTDRGLDTARTAAAAALNTCDSGCSTADDVVLTTTSTITRSALQVAPQGDGNLEVTASDVPVRFDSPFSSTATTVRGAAVFTVPLTFDGDALVAGEVRAELT
ncbi:hypothetical protein GCM10027059_50160 [Myceligenerans halotolerans]